MPDKNILKVQEKLRSTCLLHMRAATVVNIDVTKCVAKGSGHTVGGEEDRHELEKNLSNAHTVRKDESKWEGRLYIISDCSSLGSSLVFTSWLETSLIMTTECLLMEKSGLTASSRNSFLSRC